MALYLLWHRHEPAECRFAYAAWHGFDSPLRHRSALSTCEQGGHETWWVVEAADGDVATAHLPFFVASRSTVRPVSLVQIP